MSFSKISRYRKLSDDTTIDASGRNLASKGLRMLSLVSGTFLHTIEEPDRLDHLAYKYYKQPRKWWRICDANSEFLSPQALLGKEPLVVDSFPLTFDDSTTQPPWSDVLKQLSETLGVDDFQIVDDEVELVEEQVDVGGEQVTVLVPRYERSVVILYNEMNVEASELIDILSTIGFGVGQSERIGRVGKKVTIPPNTTK